MKLQLNFVHYSVLLYICIPVHVNVSCTAIVRCLITSQRIPPYVARSSRLLFRRWQKILLLYLLACYRGVGGRYDWNSRPRLYALNLRRTRLQYFCHNRVRRMRRVCVLLYVLLYLMSRIDIYRSRFKQLTCKSANSLTILHSTNDTYRKRIEFSVHTHRKALKWAVSF